MQLANSVSIGFLDGNVVCASSGAAVPNLAFSLFFAPDSVYQGSSDAVGRIAMNNLPLGPCILQLADSAFTLASGAQASDDVPPLDWQLVYWQISVRKSPW